MEILSDEGRYEGGRLADAGRELLRVAETGEGLIPVTPGLIPVTPDILQALAEAAAETYNASEQEIAELMTPERAAQVRKWRFEGR